MSKSGQCELLQLTVILCFEYFIVHSQEQEHHVGPLKPSQSSQSIFSLFFLCSSHIVISYLVILIVNI